MNKQHAPKILAIGRSRFLFDSIEYLLSRGFDIQGIVTAEAYEEYDIKAQDFENLARRAGIPCLIVNDVLDDRIISLIREQRIQIGISVNWKYKLPKSFLDRFPCGILNFHLGSLPDYKGNATVNWAILNGEDHIYANVHRMEAELDAGDVLARERIPITQESYVADIIKQAEMILPKLYESAIDTALTKPDYAVVRGSTAGLRCYPRAPEDGQIDWKDSVEQAHRMVRASSRPYAGAFSFLNGKKVIIWRAEKVVPENAYLALPGQIVDFDKDRKTVSVACRDGFLVLQEIELDGEVICPSDQIKSIRTRFQYLGS